MLQKKSIIWLYERSGTWIDWLDLTEVLSFFCFLFLFLSALGSLDMPMNIYWLFAWMLHCCCCSLKYSFFFFFLVFVFFDLFSGQSFSSTFHSFVLLYYQTRQRMVYPFQANISTLGPLYFQYLLDNSKNRIKIKKIRYIRIILVLETFNNRHFSERIEYIWPISGQYQSVIIQTQMQF